jgi:hypothetical protein
VLRFTIRDVLWLMVVVGMGVTWNSERQTLKRERDNAVEEWHRASQRWVEATQMLPPSPDSMGGLGGLAAPTVADSDEPELEPR